MLAYTISAVDLLFLDPLPVRSLSTELPVVMVRFLVFFLVDLPDLRFYYTVNGYECAKHG